MQSAYFLPLFVSMRSMIASAPPCVMFSAIDESTIVPSILVQRDTECYLEIFQMVTLSVKHHSWIPSLSIEKP